MTYEDFIENKLPSMRDELMKKYDFSADIDLYLAYILDKGIEPDNDGILAALNDLEFDYDGEYVEGVCSDVIMSEGSIICFADYQSALEHPEFSVFVNSLSHLFGVSYDEDDWFSGCYDDESIENLDLSKFNTSNVTDMSYMFAGCEYLKTLDLSSFDTSKVVNMRGMFYGCESLESLNLSSFKLSPELRIDRESTEDMFTSCYNLDEITAPDEVKKYLGIG